MLGIGKLLINFVDVTALQNAVNPDGNWRNLGMWPNFEKLSAQSGLGAVPVGMAAEFRWAGGEAGQPERLGPCASSPARQLAEKRQLGFEQRVLPWDWNVKHYGKHKEWQASG